MRLTLFARREQCSPIPEANNHEYADKGRSEHLGYDRSLIRRRDSVTMRSERKLVYTYHNSSFGHLAQAGSADLDAGERCTENDQTAAIEVQAISGSVDCAGGIRTHGTVMPPTKAVN